MLFFGSWANQTTRGCWWVFFYSVFLVNLLSNVLPLTNLKRSQKPPPPHSRHKSSMLKTARLEETSNHTEWHNGITVQSKLYLVSQISVCTVSKNNPYTFTSTLHSKRNKSKTYIQNMVFFNNKKTTTNKQIQKTGLTKKKFRQLQYHSALSLNNGTSREWRISLVVRTWKFDTE